jgi:nucleotide-binding universal stress UspA family protein
MSTSAARKILLCYDGSAEAERALERAVEIATVVPSRVTVVSVAEPIYPVAVLADLVDPAETEAHRRLLDDAVRTLRARGVEAGTVEPAGDTADLIVEMARQEAADLIVVGCRHRGLIRRLLFGSVSAEVVANAPCDVLVVR